MNYMAVLIGAYLALLNSKLGNVSYDEREWLAFKQEHDKLYEHPEIETLRRSIFAYNKNEIDEFNRDEAAQAGFELGLNHLADVSAIEMSRINGFRLPQDNRPLSAVLSNDERSQAFLDELLASGGDDDVPGEVDWRKVPGRVSEVKNQGQCGSCWAFASTGALEGQEKARAANASRFQQQDLVELSEQNLVDCVKADYGCNGGFMKDAFDFVKQEQGIDSEKAYPYEARTRKCRFQKDKVAMSDAGSAILKQGDEQQLKQVVAKFGPVAVAIDASSLRFQFYRKGVYYNKHCKNKQDELDHGVLVVGYGTDPKQGDYWIVKNSWGPKYGEHGYIRMARNKNNNCGIATVATIPTF